MKITRPLSFSIVILIIFLLSCKKSKNDPAPSNTMGANFNNVAWNPVHTGNGTGIAASYGGTTLKIFGFMNNPDGSGSTSIGFEIDNFTGAGTYKFNNPQSTYIPNTGQIEILLNPKVPGQYLAPVVYNTDSLHYGSLVVTRFDPVKQFVTGTFSFDAVNSANPSDVAHITGGKFDFVCPFVTLD